MELNSNGLGSMVLTACVASRYVHYNIRSSAIYFNHFSFVLLHAVNICLFFSGQFMSASRAQRVSKWRTEKQKKKLIKKLLPNCASTTSNTTKSRIVQLN